MSASVVKSAAPTPVNEQAISEVQAGQRKTVRAAWWGFDPKDATKALQSALRSRAKRVVVERMKSPWIVTTIQLPSDKEIVFEQGVVIEAKRGEFLGKGDCLFVARGCKHLTLRGKGATFRMHKSDYHKPPYALAEWRHALSLRGCEDVTVEGLTIKDSGGDGIYLGVGSGRKTNRSITIRNVDCDGNNRQGISVITAENLLIEHCTFRNTRGTAPEAGIDFEPNHFEERLVNCVLRNCRSENNNGHAYHLYLGQMNYRSHPVSIRFENCTSKGCRRYSTYLGVANRNGERTVRGSIEYIGCRFDADKGGGVYIRGNEADGCRLRFEGCEIIRRDAAGSRIAPITIVAPTQLDLDAGNVHFLNCVIRDSVDRTPIGFAASPFSGLGNISGSLIVESPSKKETCTLNAEQLDKWFPGHGVLADIPRFSFDWRTSDPFPANAARETSFRLRRTASLIVWARKGQRVQLKAILEPVGRHVPQARSIELASADGKTTELSPQVDGRRAVYTFTPKMAGPHKLSWRGDNRETFRPLSSTAPTAVLCGSQGVNMIRPMGALHFVVPSGVKRFALVVSGSGHAETVKASIKNAAGRVVSKKDDIAAPYTFVLKRDDDKETEVWSIVFDKASRGVLEDVFLWTVGIPPLFFGVPFH